MVDNDLSCWRCGASLSAVLVPISRFAECPQCRADLHVCRLCGFYDPRMIGQCTHDSADRVEVKDRANFCDYFRPDPAAGGRASTSDEEAKRAFDALFAAPAAPSDVGLPDSASAPGDSPERVSEEEKARRELERLFGIAPDDTTSDEPPG